jgi:hypothetical protein
MEVFKMRKLVMAAVLTATVLLPAISQAGWMLEGSLGQGAQVSSPRAWEQLNLMVTPGYSLPVVSLIRLQLGIVSDFADKSGSKTNLELRPMIAIVPPILPVYGRVILAVTNLLDRSGEKREIAYGAAAGLRFGLGPVGVFGEVGVLPRNRDIASESGGVLTTSSKFVWLVEARAGAYLEF